MTFRLTIGSSWRNSCAPASTFTHPYHSWEKGLVENTNRWIRTVVEEKRDIATVTDGELRLIEQMLNEVPRQCLGFRTAVEVELHVTRCPN